MIFCEITLVNADLLKDLTELILIIVIVSTMINDYGDSLVSSTKGYIEAMRYLAKDENKDIKALHLYQIIYDLFLAGD
jgi:hypothetical protein